MTDRDRLGLIGVLLLAGVLLGLLTLQQGCSSTSTRQALVTAAGAVTAVSERHTSEVCDAVAARCEALPCVALDECHQAQRLIRTGAPLVVRGLRILQRLVPEEDSK